MAFNADGCVRVVRRLVFGKEDSTDEHENADMAGVARQIHWVSDWQCGRDSMRQLVRIINDGFEEVRSSSASRFSSQSIWE